MFVVKQNKDRKAVEVVEVKRFTDKLIREGLVSFNQWPDRQQASTYAESYANQNGLMFLKN